MWWNRNRIMKCIERHSVLAVIIDNFINLLQKKAIFETFSNFCCYEYNYSNSIKYIFPHHFCLQME